RRRPGGQGGRCSGSWRSAYHPANHDDGDDLIWRPELRACLLSDRGLYRRPIADHGSEVGAPSPLKGERGQPSYARAALIAFDAINSPAVSAAVWIRRQALWRWVALSVPLHGTPVTDAGVAELQRACPALQIFR